MKTTPLQQAYTIRTIFKLTFVVFMLLLTPLALLAGKPAQLTSEIYAPKGIAIKGYDTVAYFTEGKPVKGLKAFETNWKDVTWRFSSEETLNKFIAQPEQYAPQYGGYCAWGLAVKEKPIAINPKVWKILDNKLYLNYSNGINKKWEKKIAEHIVKAGAIWEKLLTGAAD